MNKFGQYFEYLREQFTKFNVKLKETFLFGWNSWNH
jgi:hypothetical protein